MIFMLEEICDFIPVYSFFSNPGVQTVISAIDRILGSAETEDADELEAALEALGQIGSCKFATHLACGNLRLQANRVVDFMNIWQHLIQAYTDF